MMRVRISRGRHAGRRDGVSLAEVMIALLVLSVGVLAATRFIGNMSRTAALSERATAAASFAQQKIESLLGQTYGAMTGGSDTTQGFQRVWSVTHASAAKTVVVRVSWQDAGGHSHEVMLDTLVAP